MPPRSEPTFLTTVLHYCPCLSSEQTESPGNVKIGTFLAQCGWQAHFGDLNPDLPNTRPEIFLLARALVAPHTIIQMSLHLFPMIKSQGTLSTTLLV